jgi:hypothetical protein
MISKNRYNNTPDHLLVKHYYELMAIQQQYENQMGYVISELLLVDDELNRRGLKHG